METYISVDVETDGPIPGPHSMLSLGAAAFRDGRLVGVFSINLRTLAGARMHPDTQEFWDRHPEAYQATRRHPEEPREAMDKFRAWVRTFDSKPVFVAYPAGFDWTFVYWYLRYYGDDSPFGFQALDLKSYAMAKLGTTFRGTHKKAMPRDWFPEQQHTHIALDDAIEQGELFMAMLDHG